MSKKIDLDFLLKDLEGKEIEGAHAGQIAANQLAGAQNTKEPLKFFGWAQKLYSGASIELEGEDAKTFETFFKESGLPVLTKAQILNVIE